MRVIYHDRGQPITLLLDDREYTADELRGLIADGVKWRSFDMQRRGDVREQKALWSPTCWCAKCDKQHAAGPFFHVRMNLCPQCGDKRCPRAADHDARCVREKFDEESA